MKTSHYVVSYNHQTHKFDVDLETTDARFRGGTVWDEEAQEWVRYDNSKTDEGNDDDGYVLLLNILNNHNEGR